MVKTPSDFGLRSESPSHPELLDYLARTFMDDGWSIKRLHRRILLSSAYQQASDFRPECAAVDQENRLLWRMNRRRLDWEATRDSLLAVAGDLDPTYWRSRCRDRRSAVSRRRTIYGRIDRQNLPGLFRAFDFASPDAHAPQRFITTVPQQALFLLNGPFAMDVAKRLQCAPEEAPMRNRPRGSDKSIARFLAVLQRHKSYRWEWRLCRKPMLLCRLPRPLSF